MYFLPYWIFVKEKTMCGEVLELESEKLIRKGMQQALVWKQSER